MPAKPTPARVRWAKHVDISGDCWTWTGSKNPNGYGQIREQRQNGKPGRLVLASYVAIEIATGTRPPKGIQVLHTCDNPPCVNPAHLFLGTISDNMRDMQSKGRCSQRKLTDADVEVIRGRLAAGETQATIAADYDCSQYLISKRTRQ